MCKVIVYETREKITNYKARSAIIRVDLYCKASDKENWTEMKMHNTAEGKPKGMYHFRPVIVLSKIRHSFEKMLLVIRKTKTKKASMSWEWTSLKPANGRHYNTRWH